MKVFKSKRITFSEVGPALTMPVSSAGCFPLKGSPEESQEPEDLARGSKGN